jgi:hypothetical protein
VVEVVDLVAEGAVWREGWRSGFVLAEIVDLRGRVGGFCWPVGGLVVGSGFLKK